MWFMQNIVSWLDSVSGYFYDAYLEVIGWVWPLYLLATPLYWLYYAFYYLRYYFDQFNAWLIWAEGRIGAILSTWDIWSYFESWFIMAQDAWSWVYSAFYNVWSICDAWWSSTMGEVQGWISAAESFLQSQINTLENWVASIQATIDELDLDFPDVSAVLDWFTNWPGHLLSVVTTWWSGAIGDVITLINSAFIEREPFWAGWQDWRDKVTEFFTDPEDWLYKAADRIIERFW